MFEVRLVKALSTLLPADAVVLDIGANIGPITLPLAARCPSGIIHAFEPVAATRRFLERNTAAAPNVRIHGIGLADTNGTRTIHVRPRHPGGAHTGGAAQEGEISETIEIRTLDAWAAANNIERIDMIKLDIEGDELAFLAGAAQTLGRFRPVLAVECNPVTLWRFAGAGPSVLIDRLAAIYGEVGWIEEDGTIRRLAGTEQALRELSHHALIDLICGAHFAEKPAALAMPRAETTKQPLHRPRFFLRRLRSGVSALIKASGRKSDGQPPAPEFTFVHSPSYRAAFEIDRLDASSGSCLHLPVRLHNTSSFWYWSHWPNPVTATYRWRRGGRVVVQDGMRTLIDDAVAPGAQVRINLAVAVPGEPGEYELIFSLVQEGYAWFDQLRPELGIVLPVVVR
jgi:FkbM family methyltransferase